TTRKISLSIPKQALLHRKQNPRNLHNDTNRVIQIREDMNLKFPLTVWSMVESLYYIPAEATNKETHEKVLAGEAEAEQPVSAHIFTSHESQDHYMGMGLYDSLPVAKEVWERADGNLIVDYGKWFSLQYSYPTLTALQTL
ncbi:hypothetical protein HOY82DRAFT_167633, partial [Tuber indicum]